MIETQIYGVDFLGFLGFGNYNKPGPGVNKDEPPKAAPVRFFEIFFRKFTKLIQANLLFFVPFLVVATLMFFAALVKYEIPLSFEGGIVVFDLWGIFVVPLPTILLSPFVAGLTVITRNFVREEHAFIWSDFIRTVKTNLRLFIKNGFVCYLVFAILNFAIRYYYYQSISSWFFYIPLGLCIFIALVFIFAQYYMPIILITFDLKYRQAFKNALIFALLGAGRNLLMTAFFAGVLYLGYMVIPVTGLTVFIFILLVVFILFALISYIVSFASYPLIKRYLIEAAENAGSEKEDEPQQRTNDFDIFTETDDDNNDDYVYINGRLIKKDELDKKDQ